MANVFTNLAVPAGNGVGASVDMSTYGRIRTITVQGTFESTITIEFSQDNALFFPVVSFGKSGRLTAEIAARYMRVRQSGYVQGTANVDVGADDAGGDYVALVAPAGDGVGAAVDVSTFGTFNTIVVSGDYTGTVIIEISEDNTVWAQKLSFSAPGGWRNSIFVARYMRIRRVGTDWQLPGTATIHVGAIKDPSSSIGWQGVTTFVLRPGGVAANNVYTDWASLYVDLMAVEGFREILFDDTFGIISLPAGTYDMQGVRWVGDEYYHNPLNLLGVVNIAISEGCILQNLRDFYGPMDVTVHCTATAPCQDLLDGDLVVMRGGARMMSALGIPMYLTTNMGGGDEATFWLDGSAQIATLAGICIDIDNVGTTIRFHLGSLSRINSEALGCPVGATFAIDYRSPDSQVDLYQPDVLGTLTQRSYERHRYDITAVKTGAYNAALNELVRCDADGGTFAVTLPPVSATVLAAPIHTFGGHIVVKEEGGNDVVTVAVTAGDTIDGAAGPVTVPPGGSLIFVSDGVSDWKTVAVNRETILNQQNNFLADQGSALVTLVEAANIQTNCALGNIFTVELTADRNLDEPTGMLAGHTYMWIIVQDVTGGWDLTFDAIFLFPGGVAPTMTAAGGSVDVVTAAYDGTNFLCVPQADFK